MSILPISACILFLAWFSRSSSHSSIPDNDRDFDFDYRLLSKDKRDPYQFDSNVERREKRARPNNYHHTLPLPSPFITINRQKRTKKSNKILSHPLFFSYNPNRYLDQLEDATNHRQPTNEEYPRNIQKMQSQPSKIEGSESEKVVDSATAEQKHHKESSEHKKGGGKEHHADHFSKGGDESDKKYVSKHEHDKHEKGHHDKEGHNGKYDDHGGKKKKFHKEAGYFGGHKTGDEGEKGAEFKENGKHKKGHSTKGEHNIHKKEEYEKTKHFYDESHEEGEHEKHGGYHEEHAHKKGGKFKKGHFNKNYHDHHYGKKGKHDKGKHFHENKGHKEAGGHDKHYKHKDHYGKKIGESAHKKYGYRHSHKG